MNGDASQSPAALQTARRLLASEAARGSEGEPDVVGAPLQRTLSRVFENLRDSMGEDGFSALLARALARVEPGHPALESIRRFNEGNVHLDGVVASVEAHGAAAVTAAIEALLAALIDVLGRLIGEEMAMRLMDHDPPRPRKDVGAQAP